jgi:peroxiredoxin
VKNTTAIMAAIALTAAAAGYLVAMLVAPADPGPSRLQSINSRAMTEGQIGDVVGLSRPDFTLSDDRGAPVSVDAFDGQLLLINFWATWCAPCVEEMPSLERLSIDLKGQGLRVVAASMDVKGAEQVKPFLEKHGLSEMTVLLDRRTKLGQAFGIQGLPTTYLIDRQGRVVGSYQGSAEWDSEAAKALIRFYLDGSQNASLQ